MEGARGRSEYEKRRVEHAKKYGRLVARAWSDPEFKRRLTADPIPALEEHGISVPPGSRVRVLENSDAVVHFVLPRRPAKEIVPDERIAQAVAGRVGLTTSSSNDCFSPCDCSGDLCGTGSCTSSVW